MKDKIDMTNTTINSTSEIKNYRINRLISSFEGLWNQSFKNLISKEIKEIKQELDKMYINGDVSQLMEIKNDLLQDMYMSFSAVHKVVIEVFEQPISKISNGKDDINKYMAMNRFKQSHIRSLITYIDNYRFIAVLAPVIGNNEVKSSDNTIIIEDITKNEKATHAIFSILAEASLIDIDTKIFIDKGQGGKGFFYSTLMHFRDKGYFKREPSIQEYLDICINSFSIKISDGTARNKKALPKTTVIIPSFTEFD